MAQEYKRLNIDEAKELEKTFGGAISLSIVEGELREIHIKTNDGKFVTISKGSQYSTDLAILKLIRPKVYIAKYNVILADTTTEEITKEFNTESERDYYTSIKLDYDERQTLQLTEKEL